MKHCFSQLEASKDAHKAEGQEDNQASQDNFLKARIPFTKT